MKKLIAGLLFFVSICLQAQTFPVQNLTVNGTSSFSGQSTFNISPVMPTPTAGDSSTKGATTAFFTNAINGYATLFSPAFTGIPTAPTAARLINNTQIANTAFVKASGLSFPTGGLAITTNTNLSLSQLGGWGIFAGANLTATMPTLASSPVGSTFTFSGEGSYGSVIKGNGTDPIVSSTGVSGNTLPLAGGQLVTLVANGGAWYVTSTGKVGSTNTCANIADYGGGVGAADNSAAFIAALTANPAGSRCIYIGPGNWNFASAQNYSMSSGESIAITGAGPDLTVLTFTGATNGINIAFTTATNSVHIRDMSITTGATGQTGLNIAQTASVPIPAPPASDITNVIMRQSGSYAGSNWWGTAIELNKVSNFNITNLVVTGGGGGVGIQIDGTAASPPVGINIQGSDFIAIPFGIILNQYAQGITINQTGFNANTYGISAPAGQVGTDQLTISNSEFNCSYGIYLLSEWQNLMISHNLFIVNNAAGSTGIYDTAAVLFAIIGNTFQVNGTGTNPTGIFLDGTLGVGGIVTGNVFRSMGPAIKLGTGASNVNVQSNAYFNNTIANVQILVNGGTSVCPPTTSAACVGGGSQ